jgi:hypothetical protein
MKRIPIGTQAAEIASQPTHCRERNKRSKQSSLHRTSFMFHYQTSAESANNLGLTFNRMLPKPAETAEPVEMRRHLP